MIRLSLYLAHYLALIKRTCNKPRFLGSRTHNLKAWRNPYLLVISTLYWYRHTSQCPKPACVSQRSRHARCTYARLPLQWQGETRLFRRNIILKIFVNLLIKFCLPFPSRTRMANSAHTRPDTDQGQWRSRRFAWHRNCRLLLIEQSACRIYFDRLCSHYWISYLLTSLFFIC